MRRFATRAKTVRTLTTVEVDTYPIVTAMGTGFSIPRFTALIFGT